MRRFADTLLFSTFFAELIDARVHAGKHKAVGFAVAVAVVVGLFHVEIGVEVGLARAVSVAVAWHSSHVVCVLKGWFSMTSRIIRSTFAAPLIEVVRGGAGVLVADPAWMFKDKLPGQKRGASKHYPCMETRDVMRLPLPRMRDDCWLFLWRVTMLQADALQVMDAWNFKLAGELVWIKDRIGMGRAFRNRHEVCLLGKRGRPERRSASLPSDFKAPRQGHSCKPDAFYEIVQRFARGPYVEMFARTARPGWFFLGNEVT